MRKVFIIILCGIFLFSINACSWMVSGDDIIFKEIDPLSSTDSKLLKILGCEREDGIYSLQTDKTHYVIFNGNENVYKDIHYETSGKSLEILFSKELSVGNSQIVYEVVLPENIYTIELLQDGESIAFKAVII